MSRINTGSDPLFFCEAEFVAGSELDINDEEAVHILKSRRLDIKDNLIFTNGKGLKGIAEILAIHSKRKALTIKFKNVELQPPPKVKKVVASAIPKGERQSVLLNMATQLGMNQYFPVNCDHSVITHKTSMQVRWQRIIIGACKQSRQCYFPAIGPEQSVADIIHQHNPESLVVIGDLEGQTIETAQQVITGETKEIIMLVGPEGGFSKTELEVIENNNLFKITLGNQILRTETAAVALLAAINQIL